MMGNRLSSCRRLNIEDENDGEIFTRPVFDYFHAPRWNET
jgi:hypothetical protein